MCTFTGRHSWEICTPAVHGEQENILVKFSARMPSILIPATFCYFQLLQTNAQADAMVSTHIHITPSLRPYVL